MNARSPGWNPDPTGRHEYRYWDGATWTDDVSDSGVTAVDPLNAPGGAAADPTAPIDRTQQYAPQAGPAPTGFGPPPGGPEPIYSSGQVPPTQPVRSGPPTGLIVGLAALAVALIAGLVFVLSSDDGDDTATDDISTTEDSSPDDTTSDDTTSDDTTSDDTTSDDVGGTDAIVDLIATGMELEADGAITREQAECAAQAMVDHFGLETLLEISTSGEDPWASASTEDQAAMIDLMTDCIPADVLVDIGMSQQGG